MKLRNKILTFTVLLVLFLGLTIVIFVKTTLTKTLLSELREKGISQTKHLANMSVDSILTEKKMSLLLMLNDYRASNREVEYIFIKDIKGNIFVHTFDEGFPMGLKNVNIVNKMETHSIQTLITDRGTLTDIAVPILDGQAGIIHIGFSEEYIKGNVNNIIKLIFWIIIVVLAIGSGLAFVFSSVITKPVHKLTELAKEIGSGKLNKTIHIKTKDEIGHLGMTFNKMVKDLRETTVKRDELIKEVSVRRKAEKKLKYQAYYDHLTNLPNRIQFTKHLGRMIEHKKWHKDYLFAVLFMDLDGFKVINDSLGHIIGDKLLIAVARRLETCTRPNDMIARFGGDEFAIFLHDIKDASDTLRVANRVHDTLKNPFNLEEYEVYTTASIGIALSKLNYGRKEDILRDADSAMYRAKALGRGCHEIFDDEMHAKAMKILQLEADLRRAVESKEFLVHYQPIVSAADNRITGVEALIRWKHPQHGFISPKEFIPLAEETGLISAIGEWILRKACAQNKAWQDAGYQNLLINVNFSSRQFQNNKLPELIKSVIQETGMATQLLNIEITESIAMEDHSIRILNQLTAMGIQTSIDDFGTGYSSIGSLIRFPINTIKIHRTFIKDITIDINAQAIVKAIIAMAHSLKVEVVAEGVETEEELAFLLSQQCDKIQGYLFSPPVSEEEFTKLLEKEKITLLSQNFA
jgi:diguanylate cyclase (GGDEF)-like protein